MGFLKKKNKDQSSSSNKKGGWLTKRETKSKSVQVSYVEKRGEVVSKDNGEDEDFGAVPHIGSQDLQVIPTSTGTINVIRTSGDYDLEIVNTEKKIQHQIKTMSSNDNDLRLQTAGGVLIFDGLKAADSNDSGFDGKHDKKCDVEDSFRDLMIAEKNKLSMPDFVNAPKNYDPVASGFYVGGVATGGKQKKFYDSDEETRDTRNGSSCRAEGLST